MKKEYFRMVHNHQHYFGVVENIPTSVSTEEVKTRIQSSNGDDTEWVELCEEVYEDPELIIDWETIDYEMGIDKDMSSVISALDKATEYDLTPEVVYTSLKYMKDNPTSNISDAIEFAIKEWLK